MFQNRGVFVIIVKNIFFKTMHQFFYKIYVLLSKFEQKYFLILAETGKINRFLHKKLYI